MDGENVTLRIHFLIAKTRMDVLRNGGLFFNVCYLYASFYIYVVITYHIFTINHSASLHSVLIDEHFQDYVHQYLMRVCFCTGRIVFSVYTHTHIYIALWIELFGKLKSFHGFNYSNFIQFDIDCKWFPK